MILFCAVTVRFPSLDCLFYISIGELFVTKRIISTFRVRKPIALGIQHQKKFCYSNHIAVLFNVSHSARMTARSWSLAVMMEHYDKPILFNRNLHRFDIIYLFVCLDKYVLRYFSPILAYKCSIRLRFILFVSFLFFYCKQVFLVCLNLL